MKEVFKKITYLLIISIFFTMNVFVGCSGKSYALQIHVPETTMSIVHDKVRQYLSTNFEESRALVAGNKFHEGDLQESWLTFSGQYCQEYIVRVSEDESFSTYIERRVIPPSARDTYSVNLRTLLPATKYYVRVFSAKNEEICSDTVSFVTEDCGVRTLNLVDEKNHGPRNVRDSGGYITNNGQQVKYGMVYRGMLLNARSYNDTHEISDYTRSIMKDELGINAEIDLRTSGVDDINTSDPLKTPQTKNKIDSNAPYYKLTISAYDKIYDSHSSLESIRGFFQVLSDELNYPVYIHCNAGADRTGTIMMLLHGLLGVSYEDATRDFELTSFSPVGIRIRDYVYEDINNYSAWGKLYELLLNNYGNGSGDFQKAVENFLSQIGVTQQEMSSIKTILLKN